jgi:HEAT repeat protein
MNWDQLQLYIGTMLDARTDWRIRREKVTSAASNFDNLSYNNRLSTREALANVLTQDPSSNVRAAAAIAFAACYNNQSVQVGFRELAPLVHLLLNDTSSRVRYAAARGLEIYSNNQPIQQAFCYALKDPFPAVRGIAEHVLGLGKTRD